MVGYSTWVQKPSGWCGWVKWLGTVFDADGGGGGVK